MLRVLRKFYQVAFWLDTQYQNAYSKILNLVKWAEGGLQYDMLMSLPLDEILQIDAEANRINKETKQAMDKASKV